MSIDPRDLFVTLSADAAPCCSLDKAEGGMPDNNIHHERVASTSGLADEGRHA